MSLLAKDALAERRSETDWIVALVEKSLVCCGRVWPVGRLTMPAYTWLSCISAALIEPMLPIEVIVVARIPPPTESWPRSVEWAAGGLIREIIEPDSVPCTFIVLIAPAVILAEASWLTARV